MDILQPGTGQANLLINGLMEFFQRRTTFSNAGNGTFIADRWRTEQSIIGPGPDLDQSIDVPAKTLGDSINALSPFSVLYTAPAADVFTAAEHASIQQVIEGFNFAPHRFGTFAYQFKVKSSLPGIYVIAVRNSNGSASYIAEYTINSANTWEEKIVYIKEPPPLALGVWDFTNGRGLQVDFAMDGGTNRRTAQTEQWVSGFFNGSDNSVAFFANGGETFRFCDCMFTPGPYAVPPARAGRDYNDEFTKAQRYFQTSYELGTDPGTATGVGQYQFVAVTTIDIRTISYKTALRTGPVPTAYNPNSGATGTWRQPNQAADRTVSLVGTGTKAFSIQIAGLTADNFCIGQWEADAEL